MSKRRLSKSEIFNAVVEVEGELQRANLLSELCGNDLELRREIEELLAREQQLGSFLDSPVLELQRNQAETSQATTWSGDLAEIGRVIGPYKLIQAIGAGGMGEVWVAEQSEPVKRRVALKLIKGGSGSKEILARFDIERQALALMNHPNIARILDAGTTDEGQPYFVMELVVGKPLTIYCDENRLSIDERLRLFMEVCSGVQHAHQKGIIHRDLKPGNIIVGMQDGVAVPKIIDFGLAKALESTQRLTDQSLFTGVGQILGTLKYMSPEQASLDNLDIDTRADIYALGVILYELLTGSTPLDDSSIKGQAALKVLEFIRDKDPVKPSSKLGSSTDEQVSSITGQRRTDSIRLKRILLGDLDWIVMKALEKDRTRRYESASGFAADIRRYLNSEPVVARPPSANYRVRKFVRKNWGFVTAASLLAAALILGIIGTSWGMWQAVVARKAESIALANETSQRKEAEVAKTLANANEKAAQQQSQLALATLTSVINEIQNGLKDLAGSGEIRRQLLNAALVKLDKVAAQFVTQAAIDQNTMKALGELGDITLQFGVDEEKVQADTADKPVNNRPSAVTVAKSFYLRSKEIAQNICAADPTNLHAYFDLTISYAKLGDVCLQTGEFADAKNFYEKGLDVIEPVAAANPSDVSIQRALAISCENLGGLNIRSGQLDKALEFGERSWNIRERLSTADPDDSAGLRELAKALSNLGSIRRRMGELETAVGHFRESLEIQKKLARANPADVRAQMSITGAYDNLGDIYLQSGNSEASHANYKLGLETRKNVADADPNDLAAQRGLVLSYQRLGDACRQLGRLDDAMENFLESHTLAKRLIEKDSDNREVWRDLTVASIDMGDLCVETAQLEKALDHYHDARDVRQKVATENPADARAQRDLSIALERIANLTMQMGDLDRALALFQDLKRLADEQGKKSPKDPRVQRNLAIAISRIGDIYLEKEQFTEALKFFLDSLEIDQKLADIDPSDVLAQADLATTKERIGYVHLQLGKFKEAFDFHGQVLKIRESLASADPSDATLQVSLELALTNLGDVNLKAGDAEKASSLYQKAWEISKKLAEGDPKNADAQRSLSISCERLGEVNLHQRKFDAALVNYMQAFEIMKRLADASPKDALNQSDLAGLHRKLADIYRAADRFDKAIAEYREGANILRALIASGRNVEPSRMVLKQMEVSEKEAGLELTALGDLNILLQQPASELPSLLDLRCRGFAKRSRFVDAAAAAAKLSELEKANNKQLYNAACVFNICANSILPNEGQELSQGQLAQRNEYKGAALDALKKSIEKGWADFNHLQQDPDLESLRDLPEFKALIPSVNKDK